MSTLYKSLRGRVINKQKLSDITQYARFANNSAKTRLLKAGLGK